MTFRHEDYPACGHTPEDPCGRQWYDEPGAFDTSRPGNEHALCEHEVGFCDVYDDDEECDGFPDDCPEGGCSNCEPDGAPREQWEVTTPHEVYWTDEDAAMESSLFGDC